MPAFSDRSLAKLATCDPQLQRLAHEVIRHVDCTVLEGHRKQAEQDAAYETGHSTKPWPHSKHNQIPSAAIDLAPYPLQWDDRERFCLFAGFVRGVALSMGIDLILGADWDGDFWTTDEQLSDLVHFELRQP